MDEMIDASYTPRTPFTPFFVRHLNSNLHSHLSIPVLELNTRSCVTRLLVLFSSVHGHFIIASLAKLYSFELAGYLGGTIGEVLPKTAEAELVYDGRKQDRQGS